MGWWLTARALLHGSPKMRIPAPSSYSVQRLRLSGSSLWRRSSSGCSMAQIHVGMKKFPAVGEYPYGWARKRFWHFANSPRHNIYIYIYTYKTSLKSDKEDWGRGMYNDWIYNRINNRINRRTDERSNNWSNNRMNDRIVESTIQLPIELTNKLTIEPTNELADESTIELAIGLAIEFVTRKYASASWGARGWLCRLSPWTDANKSPLAENSQKLHDPRPSDACRGMTPSLYTLRARSVRLKNDRKTIRQDRG